MKKLLFLGGLLLLISCPGKVERLIPDDYSGWAKLTGTELDYFVPGHGDHYRISYINSIANGVQITTGEDGKKSYNYPAGSIIVKEIYNKLEYVEGQDPVNLTVMIKDPEHKNQRGGWVWVTKKLPGVKETIFKSDMCIRCHSAANGKHPYGDKNPGAEFRDYLYFPWTR